MARYFREQDIDEYRECFYLYARSGAVNTLDQLTVIMRSLGMSPTSFEIRLPKKADETGMISAYVPDILADIPRRQYMKDKNGKIAFADFLDIMHTHSKKENIPKEILEAFRNMDTKRRGTIPARDLWNILVKWGDKLSPKEADRIFREANIQMNGTVRYEEFVKIVCAPVPDYY